MAETLRLEPIPQFTNHGWKLRRLGTDAGLVFMLVLWMLYCVNGFRPPTEEIKLSDANSGGAIRQLLFTATGLIAAKRLIFTRSTGNLIALRLPEFGIAFMLLISMVWSKNQVLTVKRSIIFVFGMLALTTATHMTKKPVLLMQRVIAYFCGWTAWISMILHFVLPKACTVNPARPGLAGISNHPNTLAPFLAIGLIVSLGLTERGKLKVLLRLCQVGCLIATVMTDSVSTILFMGVAVGIFTFFTVDSYKKGIMQVSAIAAITLVASVGLENSMEYAFGAMGRDSSMSGRDQLWARVWDNVTNELVLGHGYGAFWYEGRGREMVVTWNPRQSHNAYLDVMADLGLAGLTLILYVFHLRLALAWFKVRSVVGSAQRRAAAGMLGVSISLMTVYATAQSFIFKMDSFPFFSFFWCMLLMTNSDTNNFGAEFAMREREWAAEDAAKRRYAASERPPAPTAEAS